MTNVQDFLRYRSEARVLFPTLKPYALVVQDGPEPEWRHFNFANIPQYNIPLGYDMNANQEHDLVGYHEPGHEYEEDLRRRDPTKAHRQKFLTFIGETRPWDVLKAAADAKATPNEQHDADPGEWWADAFANGVAGRIVVDKDRTKDAIATRAFFQSLTAATQPAPPEEVPVNALPELAPVYYSQWDPDHVGQGDCVPTSAKMLLRWYTGEEYAIAHLRDEMDLAPDGIRNLGRDSGIALEACRQVLNDHGVPSTAVLARDLSIADLLALVRAGRLPIIFEFHGYLSTRMDQGFRGLHAVWLVGVDDEHGTVDIKDPDRYGPNKANRWTVLLEELTLAYTAGAAIGGGAIIPNEPRKGWDDDMAFTDEDRRKLDRVYQHSEAFEPMDWISALQHWLAKAIKSIWPNADLSGPDVKTGKPFQ